MVINLVLVIYCTGQNEAEVQRWGGGGGGGGCGAVTSGEKEKGKRKRKGKGRVGKEGGKYKRRGRYSQKEQRYKIAATRDGSRALVHLLHQLQKQCMQTRIEMERKLRKDRATVRMTGLRSFGVYIVG